MGGGGFWCIASENLGVSLFSASLKSEKKMRYMDTQDQIPWTDLIVTQFLSKTQHKIALFGLQGWKWHKTFFRLVLSSTVGLIHTTNFPEVQKSEKKSKKLDKTPLDNFFLTNGDNKGETFSILLFKFSIFGTKKSENAISTFFNRFLSYLAHFFGKIVNFPIFLKNRHFDVWKAVLEVYRFSRVLKNRKLGQSAKIA